MMTEQPRYPVTALDRGLQLLATVRDEGSIRVHEAAEQLGVAQSTAHRILRTLVHSGFMELAADHSYRPGRQLGREPWERRVDRDLVISTAARPMSALAHELGASTNLVLDEGDDIRVLLTVVTPGGTPDRTGTTLPAHRTAGGRALLSALPEAEVWVRYPQCARNSPPADMRGLVGLVGRARRSGYATAFSELERGVAAVAVPVRNRHGRVVAALTASGRVSASLNGRGAQNTAIALRRLADSLGSTGAGLGRGDGLRPSDKAAGG